MGKEATALSLYEIMDLRKTGEDAIRYFEGIRWGDKPACVECGCDGKVTAQKKAGDYWCGDCRGCFNAFTNTPMERSKVDIRKWIYASCALMASRKGISPLQPSKEIGVRQRAAWCMLHRSRLACGEDLQALSGHIGIGETCLGGKEADKHESKRLKAGRGAVGKQAAIGMKARGGHVRAVPISNTDPTCPAAYGP